MHEAGYPALPPLRRFRPSSRGMIEFTLSDGRHCRLDARRDPAPTPSGPSPLVVHCTIDGRPTLVIPLHAGWAETATLPPEVVDAIIRHFLLQ